MAGLPTAPRGVQCVRLTASAPGRGEAARGHRQIAGRL